MESARLAIVWSPEAEEDLIQIWSYLADHAAPHIADMQLNAIENACLTLRDWPQSGRPRGSLLPGLRSAVAAPYVIFYRVRNDTIEVARVLHGRRDIDAVFTDPPDRPES